MDMRMRKPHGGHEDGIELFDPQMATDSWFIKHHQMNDRLENESQSKELACAIEQSTDDRDSWSVQFGGSKCMFI